MTTVSIHTIPADSIIKDEGTFLCVFDDNGDLITDYDLSTGLRLLGNDQGLTLFVNAADFVGGAWALFLTTVTTDNGYQEHTVRIDGFTLGIGGTPDTSAEYPWTNLTNAPKVSRTERQSRLDLCLSCPLLDKATMRCTVSGAMVLDVTTRADKHCPEGLWGDKDWASKNVDPNTPIATTPAVVIDPKDQQLFESELDAFLEGL